MDTLKKKTQLDLYQMIKCETNQFCTNTAMHGYKYIAHKNSSTIIKFSWTFLIFLSFVTSIFLLFSSWQYNTQNPIETVADSVHNPIWNYQFPAITICNINQVSLKKVNSFIKKIKDPIDFDKDYITTLLKYFVKVLKLEYNSAFTKYYDDLQKLIDVNNFTVQEIMMSIRSDCTDLLRRCTLKSRIWRCDSLFEETTSPDGLCCSSNYYGLKDRLFTGYLSDRYKKKARRMSACGYQSGYKILINNQPDDYYLADISGYGVKIIIHNPYDYPGWSASKEILGMLEEAFIAVIPELIYATEDLKSVTVSDRHCLFSWEKSLKYFNNYSHINCLTECRVNLIKDRCGCVPLFFWQLNSLEFIQSNVYACNIKKAPCIASLTDLLVSFLPGFKYKGSKKFDYKNAEDQSLCKCLPSCENNVYYIETSKTLFSRKHAVNNIQFFNDIKSENHSLVSIYFKDLVSVRYRKDINMNWYSELAWFGGFLGLCLGFSFTSGFEILYYLTIRLYINYFYRKKLLIPTNNLQNAVHDVNKTLQTRNNFQVFPMYHIDDHYSRQPVPPLHELYKLKKTNNCWYID